MQRKIRVTDTTLRDGHQSLWATRMRLEDMVPIIEKMDQIGYHSVEVWGGATFDVCMRYLNEDPWERLRILRSHFKKTKLQMLLRGQSLVGYTHYADDLVEAFVHKAVENGMDIIRIFDALNDIRNMEAAMRYAKKAGAHVQAAIVYTISPVHTMEHYVETAVRLAEMGADSLCIKDMAGLLLPFKSRELVTKIKEKVDLPLQMHTHYIGGMAVGALLKGIEAGVDVFDAAALPLAFGASQPPIETVVRALSDTEYDTGLDIHALFEITRYFEDLRKRLGYSRGVTRINDMQVFDHQVPGGMISNLVSQLEEQKAGHRLNEVLQEIPSVRSDMGYPPLVTPTSQIIGTQAVLNVLLGERYKIVPGEVKGYVKGLYGKPPAPLNPEVAQRILKGDQPIEGRPADQLPPAMERLRRELGPLAHSEEDVISYGLFPQVALKFFDYRKNPQAQLGLLNDKSSKEGTGVIPHPVQEIVSTVTQPAGAASTGTARATVPTSRGPAKKGELQVNIQDVKELIQLINGADITEVQLETEGVKVMIRKGQTVAAAHEAAAPIAAAAPVAPAVAAVPAAEPAKAAADLANNPNVVSITAPMVGTFYCAPAPDARPYVEVGSKVDISTTVCIIEAMKLMNEIEAEVKGTIVQILVENGAPVEYGQTLFLVEKS
ncbi:acetyl-CoA carboxylase biotin carboxyl carrier protein [Heliophilum fasciatum]|uniref:Oxaloacetate decarboxylase alpha subunit n=1 Tax=Heliophilum fasciatum TaxID=35700 RepID=A0A4R2RWM8_9FIRM|nr:acetyl-CoA carboxylase biotin carboxyl carrier protein [Heliophilum fasciatum]MCW2277330.1 oxaloacetate decarboxylase alpha subunit [Heliophilum fasciatum]TCP67167.1 oxaloacetate decarboxylase alpha subunit [Heliophilum fasciatum]